MYCVPLTPIVLYEYLRKRHGTSHDPICPICRPSFCLHQGRGHLDSPSTVISMSYINPFFSMSFHTLTNNSQVIDYKDDWRFTPVHLTLPIRFFSQDPPPRRTRFRDSVLHPLRDKKFLDISCDPLFPTPHSTPGLGRPGTCPKTKFYISFP